MQRIKLTEDTEVDPNGHALHVGGIVFSGTRDVPATPRTDAASVLESIAHSDRTLEPIKDDILDVCEEIKTLRAERELDKTALEVLATSDTFFRKAAKEAIERAERLEEELEGIRQRAKAWSDAAIEGLRTISRLVSEEK